MLPSRLVRGLIGVLALKPVIDLETIAFPNKFIRKLVIGFHLRINIIYSFDQFDKFPVFSRYFADKSCSWGFIGLRPLQSLGNSGIPRQIRGQQLL